MTPERWRQQAHLDQACGPDRELPRQGETVPAGPVAESQIEETVTVSAGQYLGPYRVLAQLGAGGMGVVYRAHDPKLGRDVAVKTLPPALAGNPESLARFRREARTLASLNHPNVGAIYELAEFENNTGLVLELVEGETLRGPLPLARALDYARQIAEALEAAHAKGITHRDLKPANIKVTPEGRVKVLDFGLAKAVWGNPRQDLSRLSHDGSQTIAGQIVGTPPFMSPEQARGEATDQRTDIWAFGCVLYELLSGQRAFGGASLQEILRAIFERDPDWSALPAKTPAGVRTLLRRCFEKDPARRLSEIRLAREELGEPARRVSPWTLVAAGVAIVAVIAAGIALLPDRRPPGPEEWVQLTRFPDSAGQPSLSPDGRMVTFIRGPSTFTTEGEIYVKSLPDGDAVQLTNDGLAKMSPVFSPDGGRIAYTVGGGKWDTWLVPVINGHPRLWLENASGLTWTAPGRLLFSEVKDANIHMAIVSSREDRGESRDVYVPGSRYGMAHRSYLSPDGKSALIVEMDNGPWIPCRLVSVDGRFPDRQVGPPNAGCTFAAWSKDGKWMYLSSSAGGGFHTWRQRFPDGEPEQITSGPTEEEGIAMAPDGESFVTAVASRQSAVWIHTPQGERQVSIEGFAFDPKFTPDGKKLLYRILKGASLLEASELRVTDLESGVTEPLLPDAPLFGGPASRYDVSPDGREAAAISGTQRASQLWIVPLDRRSPPRPVPGLKGMIFQPGYAPGGEIIFRMGIEPFRDLYSIRSDGSGLRRLIESVGGPRGVSPDARWAVVLKVTRDSASGVEGRSLNARSLFGEPDIQLISPAAPALAESVLKWSRDGRTVYFVGASLDRGESPRSYAFPLASGKLFPDAPPGGFRSEAEMAAYPGAEPLDVYDFEPGPSGGVYAYTRASVQRNLYRIPVR